MIVALTFVVAGIVKGVTGMGLPTVSMGILGAFMSPVAAAALLLIPSFVTNVWQLATGPSFVTLMSRLWLMLSCIVIGTLAGPWLLTSGSTKWTTVGLGLALVIYALTSLLARPLSVPRCAERWLSPLIGVATGLVAGGTVIRGRISAATFRRWFLVCLVLLGLELVIRPLV